MSTFYRIKKITLFPDDTIIINLHIIKKLMGIELARKSAWIPPNCKIIQINNIVGFIIFII